MVLVFSLIRTTVCDVHNFHVLCACSSGFSNGIIVSLCAQVRNWMQLMDWISLPVGLFHSINNVRAEKITKHEVKVKYEICIAGFRYGVRYGFDFLNRCEICEIYVIVQ